MLYSRGFFHEFIIASQVHSLTKDEEEEDAGREATSFEP